jgi:hypothetical protein
VFPPLLPVTAYTENRKQDPQTTEGIRFSLLLLFSSFLSTCCLLVLIHSWPGHAQSVTHSETSIYSSGRLANNCNNQKQQKSQHLNNDEYEET